MFSIIYDSFFLGQTAQWQLFCLIKLMYNETAEEKKDAEPLLLLNPLSLKFSLLVT